MNKLNMEGYLILDRFGFERTQYCPYHGSGMPCGIWCPLFVCLEGPDNKTVISMCNNTVKSFSKENFVNEYVSIH
jgi:Zn-finger protein